MGKSYQRRTRRSRRKMQNLAGEGIRVEMADGKASFQMVLPMSPLKYHGTLSLKPKMAWGMTDYDKALQELRKVRDWLASINQEAAASLKEGLEETLTIHRVGLPAPLRRIFSSTNLIESCFSRAGDLCRNMKHWRDGNMARRWAASVLREAQRRFRRIQAYRQLPQLINAMATLLDRQEAAA